MMNLYPFVSRCAVRSRPVGWAMTLVVIGFLVSTAFLQSTLEDLDDENLVQANALGDKYSPRKLVLTDQGSHPTLDHPKKPAFSPSLDLQTVRQRFEQDHPFDLERIQSVLKPFRIPPQRPPANFDLYDIYNCPETPPADYPYEWNALEVLDHWGVDTTDIPPDYVHQGLCVFDWQVPADRVKVQTYRAAEVPFVLRNHDEVLQTAERWSSPGYLEDLLGTTPQRNEHSFSNHFMFWRINPWTKHAVSNWESPTDMTQLSYQEWLDKAKAVQASSAVQQERWYFRLNGERRSRVNMFLYEELPFFLRKPNESTLFMVDAEADRGINCRFGMKGIFAESHFDPTRNWVMVLGGQRRYLLSHFRECSHLQLYPFSHPSGRHSAVNWSRPRQHIAENPALAGFQEARMNEVVLQAGDALYLPTSWFHAIVSLTTNYQCNARSGVTHESWSFLESCGFMGAGRT